MQLLRGAIRTYAWGSRTVLPEFLQVQPTGEPQAELWLGSHAAAPSRVAGRPLGDLVTGETFFYIVRTGQVRRGWLPQID